MENSQERKSNVLIVDDNTRNIQIVANLLQETGCFLSFAQDGPTALKQINENRYDLILLDIMMPGMDGYEVCRNIKSNERSKDIPVIFLTAKNDAENIAKAFETGGVDYITKPFNTKELKARVKTHLQLQKTKNNLLVEIEERKKTEEKLRNSQERLKELNSTKDKFFSIIAHDLKEPFSNLIGFSELLIRNVDNYDVEKVKQFVYHINSSSQQGYRLLKNLLDWSRSQTGRIKWNPQMIALKEFVDTSLEIPKGRAIKKYIAIENQIHRDIKVYIDAHLIETVIRNLVSNAIKFTHQGGKIQIQAIDCEKQQSDKEEGGMIEVAVSDNGVGIHPDDQKKLFRLDVSHSTTGTNNEIGTGLGLILCKEFVEKHNGKIRVESQEGKGATFRFTLPKQPLDKIT